MTWTELNTSFRARESGSGFIGTRLQLVGSLYSLATRNFLRFGGSIV
jgi:hypothetical protein